VLSPFVEAPPLGCRHDEQPFSFQCCSLDTYFLWCHRSPCRSGRDADPQRRPLASTLGQNVLLVDHRRGGDCGGDVAHPIRFVFVLVTLFSFYLAFSGYRVLSRKTPQQRPSKADWTAASTMLPGGLALVAYGVCLRMTSSFGIVAIVFGVIGLLFGMSDMRDFLHHPTDKWRGGTPYDENAVRLYCHGNGVFGRELSISTAPRRLALGDGRRDCGYRYLDEILSKEV
jgi:hypothetical protein